MPGQKTPSRARAAAAAVSLLLTVSLPGYTQSSPRSNTCPVRIGTDAAHLPDADQFPGFAARFHDQSMAYLLSVGISDGPISVSSAVQPVSTRPQPQWNLESLTRIPVMVCRYEGGIVLTRALGPGLKVCVANMLRADPKLSAGIGFERASLNCQ